MLYNINKSINQYIYIIAEAKRKWIPTIKEVLTNKIIAYLKFRHVSLKKVIHYIVWQGEYRLTVVGYIKKKKMVKKKKKNLASKKSLAISSHQTSLNIFSF